MEGYDDVRFGDAVALAQIDAREYPQSGFSGREGGRAEGGREAREDVCTESAREREGGRSDETKGAGALT